MSTPADSRVPGRAEAVVFVHGNPGPADDWRDLLGRAGEFGATKDAYLPCDQAERQRQMFPSAQVELIDGHGHWPRTPNASPL